MSTRTARVRLLAAAGAVLAALALSACRNGEGVRDEGPSSSSSRPGASLRIAPAPGTTSPRSGSGVRTTAAEVSLPVGRPPLAVTGTGAATRSLGDRPEAHLGEAAPWAPGARHAALPGRDPFGGGRHRLGGRTARTLTLTFTDADDALAATCRSASGTTALARRAHAVPAGAVRAAGG
ncbi:hypothetical protein [Streptomyces sp. NPDC007264]|uniref:hypothetical protein n=1 Tax=Streptomyces sp. NPDC007264 TaxID=3364777 RepID=UPI0036DAB229